MDIEGEKSLVLGLKLASLLAWTFIAVMFGFIAGGESGRHFTRLDAVRHGVGKWTADDQGRATFSWKESK